MECRIGCAACCIEISISSSIPGMPGGKPAGIRCVNLNKNNECIIHSSPDYPNVCRNFTADLEMCGSTNEHACKYIRNLEKITS